MNIGDKVSLPIEPSGRAGAVVAQSVFAWGMSGRIESDDVFAIQIEPRSGNGPADDFKSSWQPALGYQVSVKMDSRWRGQWLREILCQTQTEDSLTCGHQFWKLERCGP